MAVSVGYGRSDVREPVTCFSIHRAVIAAYCISAEHGERANRATLDALESRLLAATSIVSNDDAIASLRHPATKIWLEEKVLGAPGWKTCEVHINYAPWVAAAADYVRSIEQLALKGETTYRAWRNEDRVRLWGVRAPECELFEIKGPWIAANGTLHVGKPPQQRAADIRQFGWS